MPCTSARRCYPRLLLRTRRKSATGGGLGEARLGVWDMRGSGLGPFQCGSMRTEETPTAPLVLYAPRINNTNCFEQASCSWWRERNVQGLLSTSGMSIVKTLTHRFR
jgi:hypothetical protein